MQISKAQAIFVACTLIIAINVLDGFFKEPLYGYVPALFWLFDVFKFVVLPGALLLWLWRGYGIRPVHYGMRAVAENESWLHFLGLTVFLAIVLNLVYQAAFGISWAVLRFPETKEFYYSIRPEGWLRVAVALYYAITAGVVEEIFNRALPLLYLVERYGKALPRARYLLVTSLLFGISHFESGTPQVVATFVFGLLAGALYLKLRDLWPLIGAHFLIDAWVFW